MRASPLLLALSVAGAVSITATSALLVPNRTPQVPLSSVAPSDTLVTRVVRPESALTSPPSLSDDVAPTRTVAPIFERELRGSLSSPADCSFDVTFVPTDDLGRPMPGRTVYFALDGHCMNDMGTSSSRGELSLTWKGSMPSLNGMAAIDGEGKAFTRVRLEAGKNIRVRLNADGSERSVSLRETCSTTAGTELGSEKFQFSAKWWDRSIADFQVPDRRGTFTDPMLLARVIVPEERNGGFGFGGCGCCGGYVSRRSESISFFVHDEAGIGIPHVAYRALIVSGGSSEGRADGDGRFAIDVRTSEKFDVYVGGGDRLLVKTGVSPRNHPVVIDVTIPRCVMGLGRLVSASGAPLSDWIVSAHGPDGFVGAMRTDEFGCFAMAMPDEKPVELRARPLSLPWAAAGCVARSFRGTNVSQTITVPSPDPVAAICRVDVPADIEAEAPSIRLVRSDTGEGIELMPFEIGAEHDGIVRFGFRDDTLLSGDYVLEIMAPGCEPLRKPAMPLTTHLNDLGVITPHTRPRMRIDGPGDGEWEGAMIETRVQGVRVTSKIVSSHGLYAVPEGEFGLYIDHAMRPGMIPSSAMRTFRTQDGCVVPFEATLSGTHPR